MPVLGDLPSTEVPSGENLPNPVIMPDMEFSKSNFREQMESAKNTPTETPTEPTEPKTAPDFPPATEPKPETKPEPEAIPEKGTTDDKVEAPTEPTTTRSDLPEELLTGKKSEPQQIDDAIQEIRDAKLPPNAKKEQIESFGKLKSHAERVIQEKLARITELESKGSDGASKAEIESAQERVKLAESKASELEQTIERIAFTESPKFKRFINDEQATLTNAKAYFEGTEINPEIVEYAARVTGAQRTKILRDAGADAELIGMVSPYLAQFDNIQRYKTGALENWKAEQGQFLEQQKVVQQQQVEQRKKAEDEVWNSVADRLTKEVAAFQKFDSSDSWNEQADKLKSEWKRVFNGEDGDVNLELVAEYLGYGVAFKSENKIRMALTEENKNLRVENAKLKSARPGASNGQVSTGISNDANLKPEDAAKARFNREMAAAKG